MQQRTHEWFEARKGRVTGSVVGAILGLDPYRTRDDVMRSMVREYHGAESEFVDNPALAWGRANEDGATAEFQMETGLSVQPVGFLSYAEWLGASPDGLIDPDAVFECKCPFRMRKDTTTRHKTVDEQPHYYAQMQIEMLCAERTVAHFYQWAPHVTQHDIVHFDQDWINENVPKLATFYAEYLREIDNRDHLDPKRKSLNTNRAIHLVSEYDDLQEAIDRANEKQKEIMAELIELAGDRDCEIDGRKLTKVQRKGSISYAKAIKELAPDADLEKWRGKDSEYWRLG